MLRHHNRGLAYDEIKARVYLMIRDNDTNPMNPYLILVRSAGTNAEYVKLLVYQNRYPWRQAQDIHVAAGKRTVWKMAAYAGTTLRSSIYVRLPLAVEARNFYNILHRIQRKQQRVTPELIRSITDPQLKQKLIEACCMAAI